MQIKPQVYDIIDMDVLRSFTNFANLDKEALKRILKTTAYDLQDGANYCQGMNYIAGYFLILSNQDEAKAFYRFRTFIQVYMTELYLNSFEKLQCYFYVLDSIIKSYLPAVFKNFKVIINFQETQNSIHLLCLCLVYYSILQLSAI